MLEELKDYIFKTGSKFMTFLNKYKYYRGIGMTRERSRKKANYHANLFIE